MNDPLKIYRRKLRLWKNKLKLKREAQYYLKRFQDLNLAIPTEEDLKQEMKKRFPLLASKAKGSLSIAAFYHNYNWENESLQPSLEKFGRVRRYDWGENFSNKGKNWSKEALEAINKALLDRMESWMAEEKIDVIFAYVSGEVVWPETLKAFRRHQAPMINLSLNDKESFVGKVKNGRAWGMRDICGFFDLCWTSTQDALIKYRVENALPLYLPEAANPQVHKPYPEEKSIDVSFVGQCYGNRREVINALRQRGIAVEAYGAGWPKGHLSTEEMVRIYSRSKINLGFGGIAGHDDTFCLKGRDFEIPMSGGLYITEDHPELTAFFEPGEEILTYSGIDELAAKIKYCLANPEKTEKIRERGRARALREHTWEMRFEKIFRLIGLLK